MKGITLDSGATVNVCPGEYGMQSDRHIEVQAVDVSLVENHGSRERRYQVGDEAMNVRFEVTSVKKPIVSMVALEDTGWWFGDRCGDLLLRVDRVNDVYWILGLEGLDRDRYDLVTDRVCSLEEIELEQPQVRGLESLPDGHLIQPSRPLLKELSVEERLARKVMHLLSCLWCETCVESFDLEEPHCIQRGGRDYIHGTER